MRLLMMLLMVVMLAFDAWAGPTGAAMRKTAICGTRVILVASLEGAHFGRWVMATVAADHIRGDPGAGVMG